MVYTLDSRETLKKLKPVTISPKLDKAGNVTKNDSGSISNLLLTAGTPYYIAVEATKAAKSKNTGYDLTIGGTQFDNANNTLANKRLGGFWCDGIGFAQRASG